MTHSARSWDHFKPEHRRIFSDGGRKPHFAKLHTLPKKTYFHIQGIILHVTINISDLSLFESSADATFQLFKFQILIKTFISKFFENSNKGINFLGILSF